MRKPSISKVSSKKNVVLRFPTKYHEIADMRISFNKIENAFSYLIQSLWSYSISYFFAEIFFVPYYKDLS